MRTLSGLCLLGAHCMLYQLDRCGLIGIKFCHAIRTALWKCHSSICSLVVWNTPSSVIPAVVLNTYMYSLTVCFWRQQFSIACSVVKRRVAAVFSHMSMMQSTNGYSKTLAFAYVRWRWLPHTHYSTLCVYGSHPLLARYITWYLHSACWVEFQCACAQLNPFYISWSHLWEEKGTG